MSIYISGSLAYDRIMTFNGKFKDHILIDKLHMLNVSFRVDSMDERRGGCAGNIAYSLSLLNEKPIIISSAGRDFIDYSENLKSRGLPLDGIKVYPDMLTAVCYITTDLSGNQIAGFYPSATNYPASYNFPSLDPDCDLAIVSPGNMDDMRRHTAIYRDSGVRYIYDPGQQITIIPPEDMRSAIEGAFALIANDYELNMICQKIGLNENEILGRALWLVTTLGSEGARIRGADGTDIVIESYPVETVVDPTGAGDAERAGVLKGLAHGLDVPDAAKFGSISASFTIEHLGTQEHTFTLNEFQARYEKMFGKMPDIF